MAKVKAESTPRFTDYEVPAGWILELNSFDMTGEKNKTKGTSNKFYHMELQVAKDGRCQLFTQYGPTGRVQANEYRFFGTDRSAAESEFNAIKKSKLKKGYVEIDVAQRALGSVEAQKHVKAVILKNADAPADTVKKPTLHSETARLISTLMGATNKWVIQTLKCPLGQLTNDQVNRGRQCLASAKQILSTSQDNKALLELTNQFYGLIPHNLGAGARGQMSHLLLDSIEKINQKEYDLDTLLDAKVIGATLTSDSTYEQYQSLDTEFLFIEHADPRFSWLDKLIQDTRAKNHGHLGKIVLLNAWDVQRNGERKTFLSRAQQIAGHCGRQVIPDQMSVVTRRTDVYDSKLFESANIIPLFHGTRSQNITGIIKQGMLIRPSGVVICGAMYGHALYFGKSSKSINYTNIKSSYWAGGNDDRAFLFVVDCALGNQKIATGSGNYSRDNIRPNHSVWARGGSSGVINDEFMLYDTNQHNIRYLLEFTCQQR